MHIFTIGREINIDSHVLYDLTHILIISTACSAYLTYDNLEANDMDLKGLVF